MTQKLARRTQAERKAESDRRIIQAAIELFAEQGYVRTTLNDIGARAGYTGGLISKRYGSKQALLREVLNEIYRSFTRESMSEVSKTSTVMAGLERYVETFLKRLTSNNPSLRALYMVMGESMGAVPEMRNEIAGFNRQTIRAIGNLIQQGVDSGELREDLVVRETAALILSALRGLTQLYLTDSRAFSVKPANLELMRLLEGLQSR